jgi:hypothetical protein
MLLYCGNAARADVDLAPDSNSGEQHRRGIAEHLGRVAGNGHRVLEQLYEQPIMSVKMCGR